MSALSKILQDPFAQRDRVEELMESVRDPMDWLKDLHQQPNHPINGRLKAFAYLGWDFSFHWR